MKKTNTDSFLSDIEKSEFACAVYTFKDKRVLTVALSKGFSKVLGISEDEDPYDLMDNDMYRDVHPDDAPYLSEAALRFATKGGGYNVLYRTKIGEEYEVIHAVGEHVYLKDGERYALVYYSRASSFCDVHKASSNVFKSLAMKAIRDRGADTVKNYDELTGLPVMSFFFDLLRANYKKRKGTGKTNSILFFDLSGMKLFNQQFGFSEGDKLIIEVSKILKNHFSNENCCRLSADRFAAFTDQHDVEDVVRTIFEEVKNLNEGKSLPIKVGVYNANMGKVSASVAVDRAKIACDSLKNIYESNIAYFNEDMLLKYNMRNYILNNINDALENGHIKVYLQPIVRTASGKVCDEEALARWEDPEKGIISPEVFIPILEEARMAYRLDLYVTEKVIEKMLHQNEKGLGMVPVSINLSRSDFYSCDIVNEILKRVDASGIEHRFFTIEITESIIIEDREYMKAQIERFRAHGFKIWMDDFGSGYSSPDILQTIHFDAIKLDKLFIDKITKSEESFVVVNELIKIAIALGSETVAEGVEEKEQAELLAELGCGKLQGFYYASSHAIDELFTIPKYLLTLHFENPGEADYYSEIGKENLYDMVLSSENNEELSDVYDTLPMSIIEVGKENIRIINCNKSFRIFMEKYLPSADYHAVVPVALAPKIMGTAFISAMLECCRERKRVVLDTRISTGGILHLLIKNISQNEVTGATALSTVILGYEKNDAEIKHREAIERLERERRFYARTAALSGEYLCMYSVDPITGHYVEYSANKDYSSMNIPKAGDDFFTQPFIDGLDLIHPDDRNYFKELFNKDEILKQVEDNGIFKAKYRVLFGGIPRYVSLRAAMVTEDNEERLIVGIINVDSQVKKEKEYSDNLLAAREMANIDSLTGIKNKKAYIDAEAKLNSEISNSDNPRFAIAVFDINNLKKINDTKGHKAGDTFIKNGCKIICRVFEHSPVYRIGGDEFVAIIAGDDFDNAENILDSFKKENAKRKDNGDIVIASGIAFYKGEKNVSKVFERADAEMYKDKELLKK